MLEYLPKYTVIVIVCQFSLNRYVALYTYKPTKDDELELVRNENYCVTEKCKDGWFRGYSVSTQKRGVFPGNYVRLARCVNSHWTKLQPKHCLRAGSQW